MLTMLQDGRLIYEVDIRFRHWRIGRPNYRADVTVGSKYSADDQDSGIIVEIRNFEFAFRALQQILQHFC